MELSELENIKELLLSNKADAEKAGEYPTIPEPAANGNDKIKIMNHSLIDMYRVKGADDTIPHIHIAIRNISHCTIATVIFEATLYDTGGNILGSVRHTEIELKPDTSRAANIQCISPTYPNEPYRNISNYAIKISRISTTEEEKVHLRWHGIRTTEGGEEVKGMVINISNVITDAGVVANLLNYKDEKYW
jgi:hypothetical protein